MYVVFKSFFKHEDYFFDDDDLQIVLLTLDTQINA